MLVNIKVHNTQQEARRTVPRATILRVTPLVTTPWPWLDFDVLDPIERMIGNDEIGLTAGESFRDEWSKSAKLLILCVFLRKAANRWTTVSLPMSLMHPAVCQSAHMNVTCHIILSNRELIWKGLQKPGSCLGALAHGQTHLTLTKFRRSWLSLCSRERREIDDSSSVLAVCDELYSPYVIVSVHSTARSYCFWRTYLTCARLRVISASQSQLRRWRIWRFVGIAWHGRLENQ